MREVSIDTIYRDIKFGVLKPYRFTLGEIAVANLCPR
jgi:hypothetical protein